MQIHDLPEDFFPITNRADIDAVLAYIHMDGHHSGITGLAVLTTDTEYLSIYSTRARDPMDSRADFRWFFGAEVESDASDDIAA